MTQYTATNQIMYHVAPAASRESIQQYGLDYTRGSGSAPMSGEGEILPRANYLYLPGSNWRELVRPDRDAYEVDISGLSLHPDPYEGNEAMMTTEPIPPERIRRIAGLGLTGLTSPIPPPSPALTGGSPSTGNPLSPSTVTSDTYAADAHKWEAEGHKVSASLSPSPSHQSGARKARDGHPDNRVTRQTEHAPLATTQLWPARLMASDDSPPESGHLSFSLSHPQPLSAPASVPLSVTQPSAWPWSQRAAQRTSTVAGVCQAPSELALRAPLAGHKRANRHAGKSDKSELYQSWSFNGSPISAVKSGPTSKHAYEDSPLPCPNCHTTKGGVLQRPGVSTTRLQCRSCGYVTPQIGWDDPESFAEAPFGNEWVNQDIVTSPDRSPEYINPTGWDFGQVKQGAPVRTLHIKHASMAWQPGQWGKGLILDNQLHSWNNVNGGTDFFGSPHHGEFLRQQGIDIFDPSARDRWSDPIVINPEGYYTVNDVTRGTPMGQLTRDPTRFAQAHPALKYIADDDKWQRRVGTVTRDWRGNPSIEPWTPGTWGKGMLINGKPHLWEVEEPGGAPHHTQYLRSQGWDPQAEASLDHSDLIQIAPDGSYAVDPQSSTTRTPEYFAKTVPGLKFMRDVSRWQMRAFGSYNWGGRMAALVDPLEPHVTLYHGTTNRALELARQRGGLHAWHPKDVANEVANHYGLNSQELYDHPYFEFSRSSREGENRIYAATDPRTAQSYADARSEQLDDALSTAHRMMNPAMYEQPVGGVTGQQTKAHREAFKNDYYAHNDIHPVTLRLNVPLSALGDAGKRMTDAGYEPSGTFTLPSPVPLDWVSQEGAKTANDFSYWYHSTDPRHRQDIEQGGLKPDDLYNQIWVSRDPQREYGSDLWRINSTDAPVRENPDDWTGWFKGQIPPEQLERMSANFERRMRPTYFHVAPSEDRERIRQHGLQVSDPTYNWADSPDQWWVRPPKGVYIFPGLQEARSYQKTLENKRGAPHDIWGIGSNQVTKSFDDPDMGSASGQGGRYVPHNIEQPELFEPWEMTDLFNPKQPKWWPQQQAKVADLQTPMGFGEMYHVSPRKNRDRILGEGLKGDEANSPWEGVTPVPGNYLFDTPADAESYAYNLHGRRPTQEPGWANVEDGWQFPETPHNFYDWPAEHQERWYDTNPGEPATDDPNGYDIYKVHTHGMPIMPDPETRLADGEWDLGQLYDAYEGEHGGYSQPMAFRPNLHNDMIGYHGGEPRRYLVPTHIPAQNVALHQHVPMWGDTESEYQDVLDSDETSEYPQPWARTPMTQWPLPGHEGVFAHVQGSLRDIMDDDCDYGDIWIDDRKKIVYLNIGDAFGDLIDPARDAAEDEYPSFKIEVLDEGAKPPGTRTASMQWHPGTWGKGLIIDGRLHTWPTDDTVEGGAPHHYQYLAKTLGIDENQAWPTYHEHVPINISPEGWYTGQAYPQPESLDITRFAQAHPAMKYVQNPDKWERRVFGASLVASWDPTTCEHCGHPMTEPHQLGNKWMNKCTYCGLSREVPGVNTLLRQQQQNWPPYPDALNEVSKPRPWYSKAKGPQIAPEAFAVSLPAERKQGLFGCQRRLALTAPVVKPLSVLPNGHHEQSLNGQSGGINVNQPHGVAPEEKKLAHDYRLAEKQARGILAQARLSALPDEEPEEEYPDLYAVPEPAPPLQREPLMPLSPLGWKGFGTGRKPVMPPWDWDKAMKAVRGLPDHAGPPSTKELWDSKGIRASLRVADHQLWFQPGPRTLKENQWGRGLFHEPSGDVHTWPEEEASHIQMMEAKRLNPLETIRFGIWPDGTIRAPAMFNEAITQADPRLTAPSF